MDHGSIGLIADATEYAALRNTGVIAKQGERLVTVAGKHHVIETLHAGTGMHPHTVLVSIHPQHRRSGTYVLERGDDLLYIAASAAAHRHPLRTIEHLQQPVVVAEAHKGGERVGEHGAGRT